MHSSSRRKAPSVKDDLFAPSIISQPIMIHVLASPTLPWRGTRSYLHHRPGHLPTLKR